jgi:hypothetical protein
VNFKQLKKWSKSTKNVKGIALDFWSILVTLSTFKNLSNTTAEFFRVFLNAFKVFSIIIRTFLKSYKSSQNRPKCEGVNLNFLIGFGHFLNFL